MDVCVPWPPFFDYILSVLFSHAANCCNYTVSVIDDEMNMEDRWNDNNSGKMKHSEKNLSQCQSVRHKSHKDWLRIEPRLEPGLQLTAWAMVWPFFDHCYKFWTSTVLRVQVFCMDHIKRYGNGYIVCHNYDWIVATDDEPPPFILSW